ncbi:LHFPL tetraspan subfamily member 5b [Pseudomonas sp. IT-196MI5]
MECGRLGSPQGDRSMSSPSIVLGVLSVCRVSFGNPTQARASKFKGYREMCWVCWVYARAHACACIFLSLSCPYGNRKHLHARTEKPNKPNTLDTSYLKLLIYKDFICVGFVSGWVFFVSGSIFRGVGR